MIIKSIVIITFIFIFYQLYLLYLKQETFAWSDNICYPKCDTNQICRDSQCITLTNKSFQKNVVELTPSNNMNNNIANNKLLQKNVALTPSNNTNNDLKTLNKIKLALADIIKKNKNSNNTIITNVVGEENDEDNDEENDD